MTESGGEKRKYCPACKQEYAGNPVVCSRDGTMLMPIKAREDELIGTILADKYKIVGIVGRGGMSVVYKGIHELMDRTVAIKMLQEKLAGDQLSVKRFQQEAKAASCLTHPNVVTIYDFGVTPAQQPYLVMDFLTGKSLSDIIKEENHVEVYRAMQIFLDACDALDHAHQKGVIHRDLKSSNIMLIPADDDNEIVKVVDFGIAKLMPSSGKQTQTLTQTGEIFGSPIYMSPEQCQGGHLDARSDIYSMGAMMYEALSGFPPLMGDTMLDTMTLHVTTPPPRFQMIRQDLFIPVHLENVVLKALEKKPEHRFQTMGEFRDAIDHARKLIEKDVQERVAYSSRGQTPQSPKATLTNMIAAAIKPDAVKSTGSNMQAVKRPGSTNTKLSAQAASSSKNSQFKPRVSGSYPASSGKSSAAVPAVKKPEVEMEKRGFPILLVAAGFMILIAVGFIVAMVMQQH